MQVVTAIDGDDAYAALEEDTWPDIVFLDYNLEVGDSGVTVSAAVCNSRPCDSGMVPCPLHLHAFHYQEAHGASFTIVQMRHAGSGAQEAQGDIWKCRHPYSYVHSNECSIQRIESL